MTVLSTSTVALPVRNPAQIEIWDWKECKQVRVLTGFGGDTVLAHAPLPDGRFIAGDHSGTIRVGSVDNWAAAATMPNDSTIISVLVGDDGSFVTSDRIGNIKQWRNGVCEATLFCGYPGYYYGFPFAVVGRRIVIVGTNTKLYVAE